MATTEKPETKEPIEPNDSAELNEPLSEWERTRVRPLGTPARRIVTAEEAAGIKEYFSQPAREPSEALKAAFRRARQMMSERLDD